MVNVIFLGELTEFPAGKLRAIVTSGCPEIQKSLFPLCSMEELAENVFLLALSAVLVSCLSNVRFASHIFDLFVETQPIYHITGPLLRLYNPEMRLV